MSEVHKNPSEETRLRKSISKRGPKNPNYNKGRYIICLETLQIFNTIKNASIILGICKTNIGRSCRSDYLRAGGFRFMYLEDYQNIIQENKNNKDEKIDKQ